MAKIITSPLVRDKIDNLVEVLLDVRYFAVKENAIEYVDGLKAFIKTIPHLRHRPTKNQKHGAFYCEYRPNKKTSWFVTFDKERDIYLVRNLFNNHTKDYPTFIRGIK